MERELQQPRQAVPQEKPFFEGSRPNGRDKNERFWWLLLNYVLLKYSIIYLRSFIPWLIPHLPGEGC